MRGSPLRARLRRVRQRAEDESKDEDEDEGCGRKDQRYSSSSRPAMSSRSSVESNGLPTTSSTANSS